MELLDCQQESHKLLNSPGSLGAPTIMHARAWRCQASHCKWNCHPPTISGEPCVWNYSPSLSSPTYRTLSPTTYPSLQVSAALSAFSLQMSRGQWDHWSHPHTLQPLSPITASELNSCAMQVNSHLIPPFSGTTSSLTAGVTRPYIASRGAHTSRGQ